MQHAQGNVAHVWSLDKSLLNVLFSSELLQSRQLIIVLAVDKRM